MVFLRTRSGVRPDPGESMDHVHTVHPAAGGHLPQRLRPCALGLASKEPGVCSATPGTNPQLPLSSPSVWYQVVLPPAWRSPAAQQSNQLRPVRSVFTTALPAFGAACMSVPARSSQWSLPSPSTEQALPQSVGTRPWVVAVTPGTPHVLEATAPDARRWRTELRGNAGEIARLVLTLAAAPAPERAEKLTPRPPGASPPFAIVGLVSGASGIVGIATGVVFGALAASSRSELADAVNHDPRCSGVYPTAQCDPAAAPRLSALQDRAFTQSTISTVSLIAGGALLVGGIVVYLLAAKAR